MRDFRVQHFNATTLSLTPKESNGSHSNHSISLVQNSPSLRNKSKGATKDSFNMDRPRSNKPRNGDNSSSSQRQLEAVAMQKLLMDRNTNNLYSSLYNSASKARDREKSGLMTMFKLRDTPKEMLSSQRASPTRRPIKYTSSQQRVKEEKPVMFDVVPAKSYRKDEVQYRASEKAIRPTSRQKSNSIIQDVGESPNKSALNIHSMSHRYVKDNSPMKQLAKSGINFLEGYSSNMEYSSNRIFKPLEFEQERHAQASSLYYSRGSPNNRQGSNSNIRQPEYIQVEANKAYRSVRPQDMEQQGGGYIEESRDQDSVSRKLHKRGISIDQGIQFLGDKQSLMLKEKAIKQAFEERSVPQSQNEIKSPEIKEPEAQVIIVNSEQEQIKYFEKLLHIDKINFDFERQMVKRRFVKQNTPNTPVSTTTGTKQSVHTRTRSMEDPGSLIHTKSSSRWNTKRSGIEEGQLYADDTVDMVEGHRGE